MNGLDTKYDDSNEVAETVRAIAIRCKAADKTELQKIALHIENMFIAYLQLQGKYRSSGCPGKGGGRMIDHLGDGVYVSFDGYTFKLMANSHTNPTDVIYLEPAVLDGLIRFFERAKESINS